ncbi:MAG: agmatine deiminase family protein, partial [Bacteroidales bacterium]|nr:agmatine deiminase family protein [Bacteroidales bacterium]
MKYFYRRILLVISFIVYTLSVFAQYPEWNDPNSLPQWMTPEEELRRDEIGKNFIASSFPTSPIHNIAEFERMEAVLIRYPLGISTALVAAMSQHTKVLTIVSEQTIQNIAFNTFQSAGVNMVNCQFLVAPSNSYWTRDYGPMYVTEGDNQVSIVNFIYNRSRPKDDSIPIRVAQYYNIPVYSMPLTTAGGNYMCDGSGNAASTDLVYSENGNNPVLVNQLVHNYLGINTYHVTIDPPGAYIKHIDCWGKFLDVDKILIGQVPSTHARYWAFEQVANYFANQISAYGTPFRVFRIYTPNLQPYTNSLILNNKVYVPIVNSTFDAQALQAYRNAMPGYEVLGFTGSWQSTDALHCRALGLADRNMLRISHIPINGTHQYQPAFNILANIIPYSGSALKTDSLLVFYKANQGIYKTATLNLVSGNTYTATIPVASGDTLITYYLFAADQSSCRENWPLIGSPGARSFKVAFPTGNHDTPLTRF